jgi:hypothetical protein
MSTREWAWRLVRPLQRFPVDRSVPGAVTQGRCHQADDQVIYAWSSSELAFMSLRRLVGAHAPAQLIREKLQLPFQSSQILELEELQERGELEPGPQALRGVAGLCRRLHLLGVWVPSDLMPSEHVLVLNPGHSDFHEVRLICSRTLSRDDNY